MPGRIIEIADDYRQLGVVEGLLTIEAKGTGDVIARLPLDDIDAVIANARGLTYSNSALVALAERGVPFVVCGRTHTPVATLWPMAQHHEQGRRFDVQLSASAPLRKRLWASLVRAKLEGQAAVLTAVGAPATDVRAMARRVRSGDTSNLEAQAARRYWPRLFGADFRRDREQPGINVLLNYGYTVARAAMARAVVASGLHPTIGLHHSQDTNPMRLVDDLVEPFRPMVDWRVWNLTTAGAMELTSSTKRTLALTLYQDVRTTDGVAPVTVCMQRLATSLAQVFLGERRRLEFPSQGALPESDGAP